MHCASLGGDQVNSTETDGFIKQIEIPVYGMTCEHCVRRVSQALEGVPGVEKVEVSLQDANARIAYDPHQLRRMVLGRLPPLMKNSSSRSAA